MYVYVHILHSFKGKSDYCMNFILIKLDLHMLKISWFWTLWTDHRMDKIRDQPKKGERLNTHKKWKVQVNSRNTCATFPVKNSSLMYFVFIFRANICIEWVLFTKLCILRSKTARARPFRNTSKLLYLRMYWINWSIWHLR